MKILSSAKIKEWDSYTIEHEPISSLDLMERAAAKCVEWLLTHISNTQNFDITFSVFCAKGNNGGDGLAIARILMTKGYTVTVHILEFGHKGTVEFQANLARLHTVSGHEIHFIQTEENFHPFKSGEIIIDALFGSGLNRNLEGVTAHLVEHINNSGCPVVSIDMPSGLFVDHSSKGNICVHATHTLSFQCYKPAFLFAENEDAVGQLHILDIGLHPVFYQDLEAKAELIDKFIVKAIYKPRKKFAHKGNFGHALLVAGSLGKMGAAILAAKGCIRSGVGLLTCHIPTSGYQMMQVSVPEAMADVDIHSNFSTGIDTELAKYDALGIGPGIGTTNETGLMIRKIFEKYRNPVVLDADALNCIAADKKLLADIPPGSVLTPHPKEFERLFGATDNDYKMVSLAIEKAKELDCIIVLKGHHTCIALPSGKTYFNSTGNPGMATAGSGDVLTGILTGLLAQGYSSLETAVLGVYLHGLAADHAVTYTSTEAMIAGDIIESIGNAFRQFK